MIVKRKLFGLGYLLDAFDTKEGVSSRYEGLRENADESYLITKSKLDGAKKFADRKGIKDWGTLSTKYVHKEYDPILDKMVTKKDALSMKYDPKSAEIIKSHNGKSTKTILKALNKSNKSRYVERIDKLNKEEADKIAIISKARKHLGIGAAVGIGALGLGYAALKYRKNQKRKEKLEAEAEEIRKESRKK